MKTIRYVIGDATQPQGDGEKIIAHVCNDIGRWGKGFVIALSKRWKAPEETFKEMFRLKVNCALGDMQVVLVAPETTVVNMIAQHRVAVKGETGLPPIRYDALEQALVQVAETALTLNASVHMPRIGCGLAGGRWELVAPLIQKHLSARDVAVVIYDLE